MSFITTTKGKAFSAGYFLAESENCERKTRQISQEGAKTTDNGGKYVPAGTVYPANDNTAEGFVYEDTDVTSGDMPCSVVLRGTVYEDRLPVTLATTAKTALTTKGFKFITEPKVTRPYN